MSFGKFRTRETIGLEASYRRGSFGPDMQRHIGRLLSQPALLRIAIQFQAVEEVVVFAWNHDNATQDLARSKWRADQTIKPVGADVERFSVDWVSASWPVNSHQAYQREPFPPATLWGWNQFCASSLFCPGEGNC